MRKMTLLHLSFALEIGLIALALFFYQLHAWVDANSLLVALVIGCYAWMAVACAALVYVPLRWNAQGRAALHPLVVVGATGLVAMAAVSFGASENLEFLGKRPGFQTSTLR